MEATHNENIYHIAPEQDSVTAFRDESYGAAVTELGSSIKILLKSEIELLKAEMAKAMPEFQKNSQQLMAASTLYAIGLLPFVAFLVLGLGEFALQGSYWLSSLIVSLVLVGIAVQMRRAAMKKIMGLSYFTKSKENFDRSISVIEQKLEKIVTATKGELHESVTNNRSH